MSRPRPNLGGLIPSRPSPDIPTATPIDLPTSNPIDLPTSTPNIPGTGNVPKPGQIDPLTGKPVPQGGTTGIQPRPCDR